jgi:serpin B
LRAWRAQLSPREVEVFLPKFTITWGAQSLTNALHKLGMRDAFTRYADFSGMTPSVGDDKLKVADVLQKAFVKVNEEGTEAAAATAVSTRMESIPPPPELFRADHPFLFLIQENATGSILFLGRVTEPIVP